MTEHNDAAELDRGRHMTEHNDPLSDLPDGEGALEAAYGRRAWSVSVPGAATVQRAWS